MINKIIEYFYPFTDNSEDFILKNKKTWYSNIYREILYSGNKGKTFKKLLHAQTPLFTQGDCILEYNWSFEEETLNCDRKSFAYYRDRFKSLKDINDYQNEEYERFKKGRKDIVKDREEYINKINKNIE